MAVQLLTERDWITNRRFSPAERAIRCLILGADQPELPYDLICGVLHISQHTVKAATDNLTARRKIRRMRPTVKNDEGRWTRPTRYWATARSDELFEMTQRQLTLLGAAAGKATCRTILVHFLDTSSDVQLSVRDAARVLGIPKSTVSLARNWLAQVSRQSNQLSRQSNGFTRATASPWPAARWPVGQLLATAAESAAVEVFEAEIREPANSTALLVTAGLRLAA